MSEFETSTTTHEPTTRSVSEHLRRMSSSLSVSLFGSAGSSRTGDDLAMQNLLNRNLHQFNVIPFSSNGRELWKVSGVEFSPQEQASSLQIEELSSRFSPTFLTLFTLLTHPRLMSN